MTAVLGVETFSVVLPFSVLQAENTPVHANSQNVLKGANTTLADRNPAITGDGWNSAGMSVDWLSNPPLSLISDPPKNPCFPDTLILHPRISFFYIILNDQE